MDAGRLRKTAILFTGIILILTVAGCSNVLVGLVREKIESDQFEAAGIQAPAPIGPMGGESTDDATPELVWSEVADAVYYQVVIGDSDDLLGGDEYIEYTNSCDSMDVLDDGIYYWHVRTWDGEEWSEWSDTVSFEVSRVSGKPVNLEPNDNASTIETSPEFSWDAVDGATRYRLTVHENESFEGAWVYQKDDIEAISNPFHKLPAETLSDEQTYYWIVEAEIGGDYWGEEPSDIHELTVDITQPDLISPTTYVNNRTPEFEWNSVEGASNYCIRLFDSNGEIWDDVTPNLSIVMDEALPDDAGPYEWQVTVLNSDGVEGSWTGSRESFGYRNVSITSPTGGETFAIEYNSQITWTSVGVTSVRIEVEREGGTWEYIDEGAQASTGSFTWLVSGPEYTGARIRVSDVDGYASSVSPMAFVIEKKHWCVDVLVSASGSGESWDTAMKTIQEAIDASRSGDEIWVKSGTYAASGSIAVMKDNSSLLGGFAGTETTAATRDSRDVETNLTMLDGTSASHIIVPSSNCVIDGFTMGNTDNAEDGACASTSVSDVTFSRCVFQNCEGLNSDGVAIAIGSGNTTISECTFKQNITTGSQGGAINISGGTVLLQDCLFELNEVDAGTGSGYGGAIFVDGDAEVLIIGCTFNSNEVTGNSTNDNQHGGAIYIDRSNVTIMRSWFWDSDAYRGGAVYAEMGSFNDVRIENCVFLSNDADMSGAALVVDGADSGESIDIVHCTFSNNDVDDGVAGGLYLMDECDIDNVNVQNCIFYHNEAQGVIEQIAFDSGSDGSITYSAVEGGWTGTGNINVSTGDVDFQNYTSNLHLRSTSLCIDKGTSSDVTEDFDGNPRDDGSPDMGAYEF